VTPLEVVHLGEDVLALFDVVVDAFLERSSLDAVS
jgi:hypothetical protein